jgi:DNA-binding winged helix-turn-helix (wHTH) protein/thioredoxin-like negative regulator of GroEL
LSSQEPVVLVREQDFSLGQVRVRPSRGEVVIADIAERLEPRVMQALVLLSRHRNSTVSRDELLAQCWGGVVVGRDALNRVISILRALASRSDGSFRVHTLARIGYRLDATEIESAGRTPADVDPVAYDLYKRAILALEQPARDPVEQALAYLTDVVTRMPRFAEGWAALAEARRRRMLYLPPPAQNPDRVLSHSAAETALILDPKMGPVYGTLANLLPRFNRWQEVEAQFHRGLEQAPKNPELHHLYAQFLLAVGRTSEASGALVALQRNNPLSASIAVDNAAALLDVGRDDDAVEAIDRALALWPTTMLVWSENIRIHLVVGDLDRAAELLNATPPSVGSDDPNIARRKLHLRAMRDGRDDDLNAAMVNFQEFAKIGVAPAVVAIHALTTLGLNAQAFEVADEIFRPQAPATMRPGVNMMGTYALAGEPESTVLFRRDTASIREMAGFKRIIKRIGLEDYWQSAGIAPDFQKSNG